MSTLGKTGCTPRVSHFWAHTFVHLQNGHCRSTVGVNGVHPLLLFYVYSRFFSPEGSDRQAAELRLKFFAVVVAGVVTMHAFHGVGCVHLSSLAVTVLMTSGSSFCLSKRLLHHSFLALTTLRTEVMLEFFAKVDDDPSCFPGKHTGPKRGVERVGGMLCWKRTRNGHWLPILRGNPYLSDSDR